MKFSCSLHAHISLSCTFGLTIQNGRRLQNRKPRLPAPLTQTQMFHCQYNFHLNAKFYFQSQKFFLLQCQISHAISFQCQILVSVIWLHTHQSLHHAELALVSHVSPSTTVKKGTLTFFRQDDSLINNSIFLFTEPLFENHCP